MTISAPIVSEVTKVSYAPFRPVQYLGSKVRVLDQIRAAVAELVDPNANVVDLFTGTTVVAQALASDGYKVTAVDTQSYAATFGTALLGVSRNMDENIIFKGLNEYFDNKMAKLDYAQWSEAMEREDRAIADQNILALRVLYEKLPLSWRKPEFTLKAPPMTSQYK